MCKALHSPTHKSLFCCVYMSFVNSAKSSKQAKCHKSWKKLILLIIYISWEVLRAPSSCKRLKTMGSSLKPKTRSGLIKGVDRYIPPRAETVHRQSLRAPARRDEEGKRQRARDKAGTCQCPTSPSDQSCRKEKVLLVYEYMLKSVPDALFFV